ncbi:MAG: hypothetical protein M0R02_03440 [Bacteroidales bacterium]|nr:hypothetical protein [Bacteroidales bacterium]NLK80920.1 hypothetical protein [Bacteroidales bacterium]
MLQLLNISKEIKKYLYIIAACQIFLVGCKKNKIDSPPTPLTIQEIIIHPSEYGARDGSIEITTEGGIRPYTYEWSNQKTTQNIYGLYAGTYSVRVCDARDSCICDTFTLIQPDSPDIIVYHSATLPSDGLSHDGMIQISVHGGVPPYQYLWSTGDTTNVLENIGVGEYSIEIFDSSNKHAQDTIIILPPTIKDIDGNTYHIIKLGKQTWMQENLRVTRTPQGIPIEYYAYNDDMSLAEKYGFLYTWNTAMNGSTQEEAQGICPNGWHIPSDQEWKELEMFLGMTQVEADLENTWRGEGIGYAMLEGGSTGFNVVLSGRMHAPGGYSLLDSQEYLWASTEYGDYYAYRRCFAYNDSKVGRWNTFPKTYGFSVRCVKNNN